MVAVAPSLLLPYARGAWFPAAGPCAQDGEVVAEGPMLLLQLLLRASSTSTSVGP